MICWLITTPLLGILVVVWFFLDFIIPRKFISRKIGVADSPVEYGLQNISIPRVSGRAMVFTKWLTKTGFKTIIGMTAIRRSKFDLLRSIEIPDCPTIIPLPLPSWKPSQVRKKAIDFEDYLKPSEEEIQASFQYVSISDLTNAYRLGKTTPLAVAKKIIKAIIDSDNRKPKMRALTQYSEKEILEMAEASTKRYAAEETLSFLDGVPVGVKEEIAVVPYHLRNGTTFMGSDPCDEDASVVKKLRDGGALIIGMTNMHEIGIGVTGSNVNRLHGIPRNPYNVNYYTGGSSSGSAAAVASGLCLIGLGTDGGGSIRIPSGACGVVGVKASFGRINTVGVSHIGHTVSHLGPICSTVRDAALVYAYIAGPNEGDLTTLSQPAVTLKDFEKTSLKGIKLGVDWRFFKDTDQEVYECCNKAVKYLESRGATVVDIQIPELEETRVAHLITIMVEMANGMAGDLYKHYSEMNPDTVIALALGKEFTGADYYQSQKQRTRAMLFLEDIFQGQNVDCIITPGLGMKVPMIRSDAITYGEANAPLMGAVMRFCQLANLTGVPGMTLPVGYDVNGLPISLQVMSGWWQEHLMLRVAHACEGCVEKRKPDVYYNILQ